MLNHIVYDSFGQVTSETDPVFDFRFGYTGRELDEETGLLYYRARYYDPAIGTFVSTDPLGFAAGDANIYRYVGNSPTNFIDPDGQNRIRRAWNAVLTNDTVYNTVNRADQFAAGFGNSVSLGATNRIRSTLYGETATRNHRGAFYAAGSLTGEISLSTVANAATAPRWVRRAYNAYDTARDIYDVGRSTYNIARDINNGCGAGSLDDWLTLGGAAVGGSHRDRMIARNIADDASTLARNADNLDPEETAALARRANQERIEAACFVAGTPVLTANGPKAIETLRPGDWVLSWDEETDEVSLRPVTEWYQREVSAIIDIFVGTEKISCSVDHPFWVKGQGWLRASQLKSEMVLQTREGEPLVVDAVRRRDEVTTVHNIEIDGLHTYFVSQLEILSHNMCGDVDNDYVNSKPSTVSPKVQEIIDTIDNEGIPVQINSQNSDTLQEGNVTLDFGDGKGVNIRVETHPLSQGGEPVRHANIEITKRNRRGRNRVVENIHITE